MILDEDTTGIGVGEVDLVDVGDDDLDANGLGPDLDGVDRLGVAQ